MKKTMKTIIALVLMMTMLMSVMAVLSVGVSAEEGDPIVWDGSTTEPWGSLAGSGTEEDPYLIEDPVDWIAMITGESTWVEADTQYFKMTADIDFNGASLNALSKASAIKLDGDGHTIYNLTAADGWAIAKYLYDGSVIKNLNFVNLEVSHSANAGGLARDAKTGSVLIENVTIDETSTISTPTVNGTEAATAFVCFNYADLTFRNCVTYATVTGGYQAAGFLAAIAGDSNVTIEGCANYGPITCGLDNEWNAVNTTSVGAFAGGLIACAGGSVFNVTIKNSANFGEIAVGSTVQANVGGLYGSFYNHAAGQVTGSTFTIENSYNAGELYGFGKHALMGGIVGMFYYKGSVNIQNVYNVAGVTSDATDTNCANGIVGFSTNAEAAVTFRNMYTLTGDAVHSCTPSGTFVEENTGIVDALSSELTLATADGTRTSTIKAEIEAIDCAIAGHNFEYACSTTCSDCGATRDAECSKEFACSDACQYCGAAMEAEDHTYVGEETTPATHTTVGVKTFTCECGDSYTEEIAKTTEHSQVGS